MKILFLVPYPKGEAPSQRFRFEQYLSFLESQNYSFDFQSFIDKNTWQILYQRGNFGGKFWGILKGFLRRLWVLGRVYRYDFVFIHREATPLGLPFVEFCITQIFRKKVIFDFDDAIWLPNTSAQNRWVAWLKWHQKTAYICQKAYKVSCGNVFLSNFAQQYNSNVILNPTTIDTENHHNQLKNQAENLHKIVIGWTGTHSTLKYIPEILPILDSISKTISFQLMIISNQPPDFQRNYIKFKKWNKDTEIEDLLNFHIGIMPLTDDRWAKGKCGFKALQYMALGIPSVVSPVGVNTEIIEDGKTGFLCKNADEWQKNLIQLIENQELRAEIGQKARQKVLEKYSVVSNQSNFLNLFQC